MSIYHEGERAVQAKAGVQAMAERVGQGIMPLIPPFFSRLLETLPLAVGSTEDSQGQVWASLLATEAGAISVLDAKTLRIVPTLLPEDTRLSSLKQEQPFGLLMLNPATRQRLRFNGLATLEAQAIVLKVSQVYGNCPKYIQKRRLYLADHPAHHHLEYAHMLSESQQHLIEKADTFFIATVHPQEGADASHRGGLPGFVRVVSPTQVLWPDYAGNTMFNTLGNLAINPHAGLLFIDFLTGDLLQLSGSTRTLWDDAHTRAFPGAERVVAFEVHSVVEQQAGTTLRGELLEVSPHNPR